jgi:hypothetical protein
MHYKTPFLCESLTPHAGEPARYRVTDRSNIQRGIFASVVSEETARKFCETHNLIMPAPRVARVYVPKPKSSAIRKKRGKPCCTCPTCGATFVASENKANP